MDKRVSSIVIGLVVILLLAACSTPVLQNTPPQGEAGYNRQISVTGRGRVTMAPDIAYVNIGVNSQSENVSEALNANNAKSEAVSQALQDMGVEPEDIQTTSFNVWPQQQYGPMGEITGTTYMVDNMVSVTVRNLDQLGQLLEASVQAGANSINSIQFDVSDRESALSDARELAVQNAEAQAEELASLSGVELGEILSVSVVSGGASPYPPYYGLGGSGFAADAAVPVSAGQMTISTEVNLTYALK